MPLVKIRQHQLNILHFNRRSSDVPFALDVKLNKPGDAFCNGQREFEDETNRNSHKIESFQLTNSGKELPSKKEVKQLKATLRKQQRKLKKELEAQKKQKNERMKMEYKKKEKTRQEEEIIEEIEKPRDAAIENIDRRRTEAIIRSGGSEIANDLKTVIEEEERQEEQLVTPQVQQNKQPPYVVIKRKQEDIKGVKRDGFQDYDGYELTRIYNRRYCCQIQSKPKIFREKVLKLRENNYIDVIDIGESDQGGSKPHGGLHDLYFLHFYKQRLLRLRDKEKIVEEKHGQVKVVGVNDVNKKMITLLVDDLKKDTKKNKEMEEKKKEKIDEKLVYDPTNDQFWNKSFTKEDLKFFPNLKLKRVRNKARWILPLMSLCKQVGIDEKFFTQNSRVSLPEARAYVLHQRLTRSQEASEWLSINKYHCRNEEVIKFFDKEFDGSCVKKRMEIYNRSVENDRDRVRISGHYYNNVVLGKRMYGPGRKQMSVTTMIGGMERRFEILDNQVNHIVFTHHAFDDNLDKCRNERVKCRDDTRVVLRYPPYMKNDFIHANYVRGPPLFNDFIVTQAPMENTVGDFWRMVWQEKAAYIFMLISRKDPDRCAQYWPKNEGDHMNFAGLTIVNMGIDDRRSPLFRVTNLCIFDLEGPDLYVEHWQGDMNNSDNLATPLQLLKLSRNCPRPTIIHCHLGISRSATLIAAEICMCFLLKGPSYKHSVQKAVQLLRSHRPFSIETPMQYIFVHRLVQQFTKQFVGDPIGFHFDYKNWINERSMRPFLDDADQRIPGHRLLSPRIDPDLITLARHCERPNYRRETHDCVGKLPPPLNNRQNLKNDELRLVKRYPRGDRYD